MKIWNQNSKLALKIIPCIKPYAVLEYSDKYRGLYVMKEKKMFNVLFDEAIREKHHFMS